MVKREKINKQKKYDLIKFKYVYHRKNEEWFNIHFFNSFDIYELERMKDMII